MADVTITVDASGDADNPGVAAGQTVAWQLGSGATGPFAISCPTNFFHESTTCVTLSSSNNPTSETLKVKHSAAVGNHTYDIANGTCASYKGKTKDTGPQTITVDTSRGPSGGKH